MTLGYVVFRCLFLLYILCIYFFNVTWVPKVKQVNRESKKRRACAAAASIQKQVNQMEHNLDRLGNSLNTLNDEYSKKNS